MAAKKTATLSIAQLEKQITQMEGRLDKARQKKVRDAERLVSTTRTSLTSARKKLRLLRNRKVAAGKIKRDSAAAQKRLRTALKAFDDQQQLVDQLALQLEDVQKALVEARAEQRYANLRAGELAKAVKETERKLKKKTVSRRKPAAKTATKATAASAETSDKKVATKKAATKKAVTKKKVAKKATTKKATAKTAEARVAPAKKKAVAKKTASKKTVAKKASPKVSPPAPEAKPAPASEVATQDSPAPIAPTPVSAPVETLDRPRDHEPGHGSTHMIEPRESSLPRPEPVPDRPAGGSLFDRSFYNTDDNT